MAASTGNGNSGGGGEGGGGGSGSNSRQPSLPLRTSKGKRARQSIPDYDLDDEEDDELFDDDVKPGKALKPKVSRGSRACTVVSLPSLPALSVSLAYISSLCG